MRPFNSKLLYLFIAFTLISCNKTVYPAFVKANGTNVESVQSGFDWNQAYLIIPLSKETDLDSIQVSFPVLKYNKQFVYSFTFDDDPANAYGKAFCTINKKWVDDTKFYHVGQERSTGSVPSQTLGYTDGCGNERRFAIGVSIWPDMSNSYIDNFMQPTNKGVNQYYPYLVWKDIIPILDFGGDIYLHDVGPTYNINDVSSILSGLKECNHICDSTIGRKMKILSQPGGNNKYITAGREYNDVVFMAAEGGTAENISFDVKQDLKNVVQYRRYVEAKPSVTQLMPYIDAKATSGTYAWVHDFSHGAAQYVLDLFTTIDNKYGKDGKDNVWFATLDEVYEYNYLKRNCVITKSISGNLLTLKFACPSTELPNDLMFHRDFSILLKGASIQPNATISSGKNVYGFSYAKQKDGSWLININCNEWLLDRAKRYTDIYENDKNSSAKEDALYFINQLKASYRTQAMNNLY